MKVSNFYFLFLSKKGEKLKIAYTALLCSMEKGEIRPDSPRIALISGWFVGDRFTKSGWFRPDSPWIRQKSHPTMKTKKSRFFKKKTCIIKCQFFALFSWFFHPNFRGFSGFQGEFALISPWFALIHHDSGRIRYFFILLLDFF